jgi:hypothetical protein
VARAVASAEYLPLLQYPHPPVLPLLDNSSSTRTACMVVFMPSSIGQVGDNAKKCYFEPGPWFVGGSTLAVIARKGEDALGGFSARSHSRMSGLSCSGMLALLAGLLPLHSGHSACLRASATAWVIEARVGASVRAMTRDNAPILSYRKACAFYLWDAVSSLSWRDGLERSVGQGRTSGPGRHGIRGISWNVESVGYRF